MTEQMIDENMGSVWYVINKFYPGWRHDDDVIQAACIGLWKALEKRDSSKAGWSTYLIKTIKGSIANELRSRKKHLNQYSIDYDYFDESGGVYTLKDILVGDEDVDFVNDKGVRDCLNPKQTVIYDLLCEGYNTEEIGRKLGCTHQAIWRHRRKIRTIWEKLNGYKD